MGHKVSPIAFRIGYIKTWRTTGYYDWAEYSSKVVMDIQLRNIVRKFLKGLPIGNIFLWHGNDKITVSIYSSKPALVLGKNDENIGRLNDILRKEFPTDKFAIETKEIKNPDINALLAADNIARQIEKKLPYRRVIKQALARALEKGGKGMKVAIGGRLNGAEIARREVYKEGNIPLQTVRSDIDYAMDRAETMYGTIGIKVWICKGDVFKEKK